MEVRGEEDKSLHWVTSLVWEGFQVLADWQVFVMGDPAENSGFIWPSSAGKHSCKICYGCAVCMHIIFYVSRVINVLRSSEYDLQLCCRNFGMFHNLLKFQNEIFT